MVRIDFDDLLEKTQEQLHSIIKDKLETKLEPEEVIFIVKNRNNFNTELITWILPFIKEKGIKNVRVSSFDYNYSLDEYITEEENNILPDFSDLSPFERFVLALIKVELPSEGPKNEIIFKLDENGDILTRPFRKYQASEGQRYSPFLERILHYILNGNPDENGITQKYIVCKGFYVLLKYYLEKMDMSILPWRMDASSLKNGDNPQFNSHMRGIIHILDPQYGIDAIGSVEPTWLNVNNFVYAMNPITGYGYEGVIGTELDKHYIKLSVEELLFSPLINTSEVIDKAYELISLAESTSIDNPTDYQKKKKIIEKIIEKFEVLDQDMCASLSELKHTTEDDLDEILSYYSQYLRSKTQFPTLENIVEALQKVLPRLGCPSDIQEKLISNIAASYNQNPNFYH